MFKKMLLILLFPALSFGQLIDSDVFPFGFYANRGAGDTDFWSESHLNRMNDSLGINQMLVGGFDTAGVRVGDFADAGIYPIPWESTFAHHYYGFATYFITEAEDETSEFRFETSLGTDTTIGSNTYRYWSGDGYMLDDLKFNQYCKASCLYEDELVEYSVYLGIKIDTAGTTAADTVGIFYAINTSINGSDSLRFRDAILVGDLPGEDPVELLLGNELNPPDSFYTVSSADSCDRDYRQNAISFRFKTFGNCTVYIDRFKLHCQYGKSLVEDQNPERAADIKGSAGNSNFDAKILSWFLKDEPAPGTYRTQKYIYDLIDQAMIDSNWTTPVRGITNFCQACGVGSFKGLTDFVTLVQPKKMMFDMYPFYGVNSSVGNVAYTGYYPPGGGMGLQGSLETYVETQCQNVREAITESDSLESWVYLSQVLGIADCDDLPDTNWSYRPPTKSELQCATYMGMCYHPSSILYYKYNYTWDGNNDCQLALISLNGDRSYLYDIFEDDINPYLKAIDSTYLRLEWARAYPYHNGTPSLLPPSGAVISSISSYIHPDSVEMDPDSGWFQIGEYADTTNAKYIMLVNRACSQGPANPDPAPSITATVRFNPTNLGLGDYVYIIDIADSIFFQAYEPDSVWADTTYSAKMPDGTIPFTTVLGPGEGRLFKIVGVDEYRPVDDIHTSWTYSGLLRPNGDVTVPDSQTLVIYGPAQWEFPCYDSSRGRGISSRSAELIVEPFADIFVYGRNADSVVFTENDSTCGPFAFNPWYGIRLLCAGDYYFDYSRITKALYGIIVSCPNSFRFMNSRTDRCISVGIWLKNTIYDSTLIINSEFYKGNIGIQSDHGSATVDSCTIDSTASYGIKLTKSLMTSSDTCECTGYGPDTNVKLVTNYNTISASDYGIAVFGAQVETPYPIFDGTGDKIYDMEQSGISLTYASSSSSIGESKFKKTLENLEDVYYGVSLFESSPTISGGFQCSTYMEIYAQAIGVDCQSHSDPVIKKCKISGNVSVQADNTSLPGLGSSGNNLGGVTYEVYNANSDTIGAQRCWWEGGATIYGPVDTSHAAEEAYCGGMPKRGVETLWELPISFKLFPNYPNPFNPYTNICFDIPEARYVHVCIYNILGQRVRTLADDHYPPGSHILTWDGRSNDGRSAASGIYFYLIQAGEFRDCRKMLLLR